MYNVYLHVNVEPHHCKNVWRGIQGIQFFFPSSDGFCQLVSRPVSTDKDMAIQQWFKMIKFNNIWLWGGAVFRIFPLCAAGLWFYAETSRQSCRCGRSLHILRKQTQPPPIGGLSLSARVWINHPASSLAADLCVRASLWWTDLGLHPYRCSQCASFTGERTNNNKRKGGKHTGKEARGCATQIL